MPCEQAGPEGGAAGGAWVEREGSDRCAVVGEGLALLQLAWPAQACSLERSDNGSGPRLGPPLPGSALAWLAAADVAWLASWPAGNLGCVAPDDALGLIDLAWALRAQAESGAQCTMRVAPPPPAPRSERAAAVVVPPPAPAPAAPSGPGPASGGSQGAALGRCAALAMARCATHQAADPFAIPSDALAPQGRWTFHLPALAAALATPPGAAVTPWQPTLHIALEAGTMVVRPRFDMADLTSTSALGPLRCCGYSHEEQSGSAQQLAGPKAGVLADAAMASALLAAVRAADATPGWRAALAVCAEARNAVPLAHRIPRACHSGGTGYRH